MLRKGQLRDIQTKLLEWFGQFQRDLPWRRTRDPYPIWISEIMLQQTRVSAAIPYYERFLARFPTIQSLARARTEEVLRFWSGLGYYSRARNLHKAAREMVAKHGGRFPDRDGEVLSLPGVGAYTAAAILSIAFGRPRAVLDGNVARVLARLGAVRGNPREARRWRLLQQTADLYLAESDPGAWNQAMMELGATVCTPRSPQCLRCPLRECCKGRELGIAESLPEKRAKRSPVKITLAAAVFCDPSNRTLLLAPPARSKRSSEDDIPSLVSGLWHFPMIPVGSRPRRALRAGLQKAYAFAGKLAWPMRELPPVRHTVTYREITVRPFQIQVATLPRIRGAKRAALELVPGQPVSGLTRKVAEAVLAGPRPRRR